jgi:hypothetical protein
MDGGQDRQPAISTACAKAAVTKGSYHLVICYSLPWKDPPFSIAKPSMGHLYHGYVTNNKRVSISESPMW